MKRKHMYVLFYSMCSQKQCKYGYVNIIIFDVFLTKTHNTNVRGPVENVCKFHIIVHIS